MDRIMCTVYLQARVRNTTQAIMLLERASLVPPSTGGARPLDVRELPTSVSPPPAVAASPVGSGGVSSSASSLSTSLNVLGMFDTNVVLAPDAVHQLLYVVEHALREPPPPVGDGMTATCGEQDDDADDADAVGVAFDGVTLGTLQLVWRSAMGERGTITSPPIVCSGCGGAAIATATVGSGGGGSAVGGGLAAGSPGGATALGSSGASAAVGGGAAAGAATVGAAGGDVSGAAVGVAGVVGIGGGRVSAAMMRSEVEVSLAQSSGLPAVLTLGEPCAARLTVRNRSARTMDLQLQFHLERMSGVVVTGTAFRTLGRVPPGGHASCDVALLPIACGLHALRGAVVVDMQTAHEFAQPPLGDVLVEPAAATFAPTPVSSCAVAEA